MKRLPLAQIAALLIAVLLTGAASRSFESPIADAAMKGDKTLVLALLKKGADVNAPQGDGMTALHWAATNNQLDLVDALVKAKANPNAVTRNGAYTPLHMASKEGHAAIVRRLLKAGANPKALTTTGDVSALHFAAGAGSADAVAALLDQGADVNARETVWGQTPLMFAAAYNRLDAVKVLLKRGADVKIATKVIDLAARDAEDRAAAQQRNQTLAAFKKAAPDSLTWRPTTDQVQAAIKAAQDVQINGTKTEV